MSDVLFKIKLLNIEESVKKMSEEIIELNAKVDKLSDIIKSFLKSFLKSSLKYETQRTEVLSITERAKEIVTSIANKQYITFDGIPTEICPVCKAIAFESEQPEPGTHAYSVVYTCGSRVDAAYNSDEFHFYQSNKCKGIE